MGMDVQHPSVKSERLCCMDTDTPTNTYTTQHINTKIT